MDDFMINRSPGAVDDELRRVGLRPDRVLGRARLDPADVRPSEWNRMGADESRVADYSARLRAGERPPPVLVYEEPSGGYRVVDGLHRVRASERAGERVDALVVSERVYREIANFGDGAMYEWALEKAGER
jgi:hypothetical protein